MYATSYVSHTLPHHSSKGCGVTQAIAVCHSAHTMHGDIKPANFLMKNALKKGSATAVEEAAGSGPWIKSIDYGCSQVVTGSKPLTKRSACNTAVALKCQSCSI